MSDCHSFFTFVNVRTHIDGDLSSDHDLTVVRLFLFLYSDFLESSETSLHTEPKSESPVSSDG